MSSDSKIHMFDLSRQKISKSFSLKSRVSGVSVNYCDAYIAAGCVDGSLQLVTVASNTVSAPMVAPKCMGHKITSVRYSSVKVRLCINPFHLTNCSVVHRNLSLEQAVRVESYHSGTVTLTRICFVCLHMMLQPQEYHSHQSMKILPCPWVWTRTWCAATSRPRRRS